MKEIILLSGKKNPYGDNEIVNGRFDTDTNWTKAGGWTISGGTANNSGGTGNLTQGGFVFGRNYRFEIEVTSITGGYIRLFPVTTSPQGGNITSTGIYVTEAVADRGTGDLIIQSVGATVSIDNVKLQEIL